MLSMVATFRSADSRSGASLPRAFQAPLNSSIRATRARMSGVICRVAVSNLTPIYTPNYTQFGAWVSHGVEVPEPQAGAYNTVRTVSFLLILLGVHAQG